MSRTPFALVAVMLLLALTACGGAEPDEGGTSGYPFRLRIEPGAGGDPVKLLAVEGQSVDLGAGDEPLTLTVETVEGDTATVTTSEPVTSDGAEVSHVTVTRESPSPSPPVTSSGR
ncbi:hypothetical protein ON003_08745 [Janibacter hoylei]|uniref:hypothetical protein n=1 Tax=Janibacter hoylei TaxID=364298 RepID=UPI00223821EA|nr:hypothetical protein [Janibacter hoylei]MCW4601669.1 hypothetical protein [Janibacter hoylei]